MFTSVGFWSEWIDDPSLSTVIISFSLSVIYFPFQIASYVCDMLFVALTKKALAWCTELTDVKKIAGVLLLNLALGCSLVWLPLNSSTWITNLHHTAGGDGDTETFSHFEAVEKASELASNGKLVAILNFVDGIVSLTFAFAAILIGVHKVLWPLLLRPLYSLQAVGIAKRRTLFAVTGMAMFSWGGITLPESIQKIIDLFAKP
jgi:hypothetical protein